MAWSLESDSDPSLPKDISLRRVENQSNSSAELEPQWPQPRFWNIEFSTDVKKQHQVSQGGIEFEAFVPASFSRAGTPHGFFEIKRFSV